MRRAQILGCVAAATLTLGAWLASAESCLGVVINVDLDPALDQFGSQIETVQIYEDADGPRVAYGIYDTGASVITVSAYDQFTYGELPEGPIPIKVVGGADAEAIGSTLNGDVSQPGTIYAVGVDAVDILGGSVDLTRAAFAPGGAGEYGIQVLVGTEAGSPSLPTITGTPIHNGRLASDPTASNGIAARIDMQYGFDLGAMLTEFLGDDDTFGLGELFAGVKFTVPNVEFVASGTALQAIDDDPLTIGINESTTAAVRVPLALYGYDNHVAPGNTVTASYNPFQNSGVLISDGGTTLGDDPSGRLAMLFDTGASLSIISNAMATSLGLNLSTPEFSVEVEGAAGGIGSIPGFTVDSLELPIDDDGDGVFDGQIIFTNVPVFVFDVTPADTDPADGLDGILGMNLFNTAGGLLYDPFDPLGPSLSLTFLTDPYSEALDGDMQLSLDMAMAMLATSGFPFSTPALALPGVRQEITVVPEPSTLLLLVSGGLVLAMGWRRRRRPG